MKITDLARQPQLIEIVLDDPDTIRELGESLTYWTWDRQPMPVFLKLSSVRDSDLSTMIEAVRELILDEDGQPVLTGDAMLPTGILLRIITRTVEQMGK
jgi:hypothetical protein